jgi:uncharacterized membrane protein (UPF0182 family)
MPQLKKVVLAVGNRLIYEDTYEQALSVLTGGAVQTSSTPSAPVVSEAKPAATPAPAAPAAPQPASLDAVRQHMRRYRELASQGRWSEAGRELEALEKLVAR